MFHQPQHQPPATPWPPGEAMSYDAQFHSASRHPAMADPQPGPAMSAAHARYPAQPGPAGNVGYEHLGVHPVAAASQSQYMGAPSQFMPGPGSINPQPPLGGWGPDRTSHVAIGGLTRAHLQPGSYVQTNKAPAYIVCPHCRQSILTKVTTKTGARTVVAAAAIFIAYWPLAFIPFVAKPLKKKVHVCTRCGYKIGNVVTVTPA